MKDCGAPRPFCLSLPHKLEQGQASDLGFDSDKEVNGLRNGKKVKGAGSLDICMEMLTGNSHQRDT